MPTFPKPVKQEKPKQYSSFSHTPMPERKRTVHKKSERAGVMARISVEASPQPKTEKHPGGKVEQAHKDALALLGCMVCRRLFGHHLIGPVELHHLRTGGWGKGDYMTLIPLCIEHHRGDSGVHGLGTKAFTLVYEFDQQDLLVDALRFLNATPTGAVS